MNGKGKRPVYPVLGYGHQGGSRALLTWPGTSEAQDFH